MQTDRPHHGSIDRGKQPARRPTWAQIDLNALAGNFRSIKSLLHRDVKIMSVVKADAYGHCAVKCARRLEREGTDWFGVALPEEGIKLREGGVTKPILSLGGFWKDQEYTCIRHGIATVVYGLDMVQAMDRAARDVGLKADIHVKIDTGMGRLGVMPDAVPEFCEALRRFRNIRVDGLMTHFASADDPAPDNSTEGQLKVFQQSLETFRAHGFLVTHQHLANSGATFGNPGTHGNLVRP